ncbi:disulfide bond formation protein B [Exilibacterium tricleocarpae]|uniref:Disulfide bond formation protein B n=1 Tax=Exilibacterium tricleocarpae TaxID=2591008 RepID=A0A545TZ70_9GAMM|nr:disulfide bond formation protein B [Exilibacterium tricleocarpae]TQV82520.1 disulfide bond formation protein B [Exilibacterium tricleocarpae]
MPGIRLTNLIVFLGCCGLILTALYMQHVMDLLPCALCVTQRVFVIAVGVLALGAYLLNPGAAGRRWFAGLGVLAAALGASFAGRHVWLQSLPPDQQPACGPSLDYILETFPLREALDVLLAGDGNCAEVVWQFLGLSIPAWTLVAFAGLIVINLWQLLRR